MQQALKSQRAGAVDRFTPSIAPAMRGDGGAPLRLLSIAIAACAFGSLAAFDLDVSPTLTGLESFLYKRQLSPLPAFAVAGWLFFRRRVPQTESIVALSEINGPKGRLRRAGSIGLLLSGIAVFGGSHLVGAVELQSFTLFTIGLGTALIHPRASNLARYGLPAVITLMAVPLPAPLYNELVWFFQQWTAEGAAAFLNASGFAVDKTGIVLFYAGQPSWVIETCTGLRFLELSVLGAIILREHICRMSRRNWIPVAASIPTSIALNTLRVAYTVIREGGTPGPLEHLLHASLVLGTTMGIIAIIALRLSTREESGPVARPRIRAMQIDPRIFCAIALTLFAIRFGVSPYPMPLPQETESPWIDSSFEGWTKSEFDFEEQLYERMFQESLPVATSKRARFVRDDLPAGSTFQTIDVMFASERNDERFVTSLRSGKWDRLGPQWHEISSWDQYVPNLARHVRASLLEFGAERALLYRWSSIESSIAHDSLSSAFRLALISDKRVAKEEIHRVSIRLSGGAPTPRIGQRAGRDIQAGVQALNEFLRAYARAGSTRSRTTHSTD